MSNKFCRLSLLLLAIGWLLLNLVGSSFAKEAAPSAIFTQQAFTQSDAILVTDQAGNSVFQWQADLLMIPASLMKLVTAYLAFEKWPESHRFTTNFYLDGSQLWVKGYGDPYLISEELDIVAANLRAHLPNSLESLHIDASYFAQLTEPGRSNTGDPYNAPLSAVAANFNTVKLNKVSGVVASAEPQTPLTAVARKIASQLTLSSKSTRVNLGNATLAQQHFAQLLLAKLNLTSSLKVEINQRLPSAAKLLYQHQNSRTLAEVLRGALAFSNNFIANQLFLLLAEKQAAQMQFATSTEIAEQQLKRQFAWSAVTVDDGAGLSRKNQISAMQIDTLLTQFVEYKDLLKEYPISNHKRVKVRAKTGSLNNVHNFAGYIDFPEQHYQFVFMHNRAMPYRNREALLAKLVAQLQPLAKAALAKPASAKESSAKQRLP